VHRFKETHDGTKHGSKHSLTPFFSLPMIIFLVTGLLFLGGIKILNDKHFGRHFRFKIIAFNAVMHDKVCGLFP
jgi:hypothetical protein